MADKNKRLARAQHWEELALTRAARALARYERAREYRRVVEMQEDNATQIEVLKARIQENPQILKQTEHDG